MPQRDTSRDGFANKLEFFLLTHFRWAWRAAMAVPFIYRWLNGLLLGRAVAKTKFRPNRLSLFSDYVSWESLTNRIYSGRHLPSADPEYIRSLPPIDEVVELFRRPSGVEHYSEKSTLLFSHFAQWFTDGFLRTDRGDKRRNTSNHDIDLSPLYGITSIHTAALRSESGGTLKSQIINGEEYPRYYTDDAGIILPEFANLTEAARFKTLSVEVKRTHFAMGVERANNHIGYVMLNVLFLREHNRIAREIQAAYPEWDNDRIFETTRNSVIVLLIKIVIEEYINHITPYYFKFQADASRIYQAGWYRTNWMTVEFNLLYRWHALVTDKVKCGTEWIPVGNTLIRNDLLTSRGLEKWFQDASSQPAGAMRLLNTTQELMQVEKAGIELARFAGLRSYNEYRQAFHYPAVSSFAQISSDVEVQKRLKELYQTPDRVEFFVGLFAEDMRPNSALPPLIGRMVGVDAFSQALTNPLLSINVFNEETFSQVGWKIIHDTKRLGDVVRRNVPNPAEDLLVTFTLPGRAVK